MNTSAKRVPATLLTVTLAVVLVGSIALVAASGTVAADRHTRDRAPTYDTADGTVNLTITLPERTDHYPGSRNAENASIEYSASGADAFAELDAEDGLWLDLVIVEASWIDYGACTVTGNTAEFGIDRGNDNSGVQSDESLLEHQSGNNLEQGGLTVEFYDWSAVAGDVPYLAPEDAVVAVQGVGSNDGPCLTMTDDPGWYQIQAFTNGTVATECTEEGNSGCEPDDKQWRGINLNSNYVYICECDSEGEAREQLGPPPNENGAPETPTPTRAPTTPTPTRSGGDSTPTPTATPTQAPTTPTRASNDDQNQQNQQDSQQTPQNTRNQQTQQNTRNQQSTERTTPTIGEGSGFTPLAALIGLLAAALVVYRRK